MSYSSSPKGLPRQQTVPISSFSSNQQQSYGQLLGNSVRPRQPLPSSSSVLPVPSSDHDDDKKETQAPVNFKVTTLEDLVFVVQNMVTNLTRIQEQIQNIVLQQQSAQQISPYQQPHPQQQQNLSYTCSILGCIFSGGIFLCLFALVIHQFSKSSRKMY